MIGLLVVDDKFQESHVALEGSRTDFKDPMSARLIFVHIQNKVVNRKERY